MDLDSFTATQRRIGDQNESYRKGLVLGLTMAEVSILIIFVLLFLMIFGERSRWKLARQMGDLQEHAATFKDKEPVPKSDLTRLKSAEDALHRIAEELGMEAEDSPDDFVRLVRVVHEAVQTAAGRSVLAEAKAGLTEIHKTKKEIQRALEAAKTGGAAGAADLAERQSFRVSNQDGQLKNLENRLAAAGEGKGERPCWAEPNTGTIDYLYDVVLTSSGIKIRERSNPSRERERALLPAPHVDPEEVLSPAVFITRTEPVFLHSKSQNCRFFVVVYDATAEQEKVIYKDLLRTVEGHFYKHLNNGPAPF